MQDYMKIRPVHPFPARMALSIVWNSLRNNRTPLVILDPMLGSGTSLIAAKTQGHKAIGFDTDPLSVLIARVWCTEIDEKSILKKSKQVVGRSILRRRNIKAQDAYPKGADKETREFIRYWFDTESRKDIKALTETISRLRDSEIRSVMWCVLSGLIITKDRGVSLARDISHSRPHKVYEKSPINALESFECRVKKVIRSIPFRRGKNFSQKASIEIGDARRLPIPDKSIDIVITSPPYLNAIDYMRGHRMSLTWMGYSMSNLRDIRSRNIGSEISGKIHMRQDFVEMALRKMGATNSISSHVKGMLARYVVDMDRVLCEIARVLKRNGKGIIVVGDSTIKGGYIQNSKAIKYLAQRNGLMIRWSKKREIPDCRRYLPPPAKSMSREMQRRMRSEIVIGLSPQRQIL